MSDPATLRQKLLDLGLEDWIPLPEAVAIATALGCPQPVDEVRRAVTELTRQERFRWWRGRWNCEEQQVEVPADEVQTLLLESRWYQFCLDEVDEERLYFVNVENIKPGV